MKKLIYVFILFVLSTLLIGIAIGAVRDAVRSTTHEAVLESIDPLEGVVPSVSGNFIFIDGNNVVFYDTNNFIFGG